MSPPLTQHVLIYLHVLRILTYSTTTNPTTTPSTWHPAVSEVGDLALRPYYYYYYYYYYYQYYYDYYHYYYDYYDYYYYSLHLASSGQ